MFSRKAILIAGLIAVLVATGLIVYRQQLNSTVVLDMYLPIDTFSIEEQDGQQTITVEYPLNRLSMSVFPQAVSLNDTVYIELKKVDGDIMLGTTQLQRFGSGTYLRGTVADLENNYALVHYGIETIALTEADADALSKDDNLTSHITIDGRGRASWHGFYRNGLPIDPLAL